MPLLLDITYTRDHIMEATQRFWECVNIYNTLAFSGEMGAGKTTFIHALCETLGVTDAVSSPTFAIINEYNLPAKKGRNHTIYHMDWYRLKNIDEAINAGIEDAVNQSDAYCFIEWPEHAPELLPHPHLWITIKLVSVTERHMQVWLKE